jgi:hypothetical protein
MKISGFVGHGKEAYVNSCDSKDVKFSMLWNAAYAAGVNAVTAANVQAMVVSDGKGKQWYVADGPCGFAWITVPGNSAFGKWGKAKGLFSKGYPKGLMYWVGEFNQSIQKKQTFAAAAAEVLRKAGVDAWSGSRMD